MKAQDALPTPIPIDTGMIIPFPNLDCSDIQAPFLGSTWDAVTIGIATIDDLREYLSELSSNYTENSFADLRLTTFGVPDRISESENIPSVVSACVQPDSQRVIALSVLVPTWSDQIFVSDLVAEYGVPDFVFWDEILSSRVLVWLAQGIAASVSVDESEQFIPYGAVTHTVYFPYQTLEGYEDRWPYTHRAASRPEIVTLTPFLPYETNPFDFESMLATMTAQPQQLPIQTFTPTSPTSIVTPPP